MRYNIKINLKHGSKAAINVRGSGDNGSFTGMAMSVFGAKEGKNTKDDKPFGGFVAFSYYEVIVAALNSGNGLTYPNI